MKSLALVCLLLTSLAVAQARRDSNTLTCESCPSAPSVQQPEPPKVHVYTFRSHWQDPPLRTNKKLLLKDAWFLGSQAAMWTAMVVASRNPKSGEEFWPEAGSMMGASFMSVLSSKYLDELYTLGISAWSVQHYIRADLR